jgi:hypothetical protein
MKKESVRFAGLSRDLCSTDNQKLKSAKICDPTVFEAEFYADQRLRRLGQSPSDWRRGNPIFQKLSNQFVSNFVDQKLAAMIEGSYGLERPIAGFQKDGAFSESSEHSYFNPS